MNLNLKISSSIKLVIKEQNNKTELSKPYFKTSETCPEIFLIMSLKIVKQQKLCQPEILLKIKIH